MHALRALPLSASLAAALCLASCTGTPAPVADPAPPPAAPTPAPSEKELMAAGEAWEVLAPSPLELEKQVREAGLGSTLTGLVPKQLPPMPDAADKDAVAFRTGVVFSYVLLSGRDSDKARFLEGVRALRTGMATLGTGQAWLGEMDEAITFVENDAASRQDLLTELDAMVESSVPEEGWGPDDSTGPLVQAGAWLTGIHLTAKAIEQTGQIDAANKLLKRKEVTSFFLRYLDTKEGAARSSLVRTKVAGGLTELQSLADKPVLDEQDVKRVISITDDLLKLLRPAPSE